MKQPAATVLLSLAAAVPAHAALVVSSGATSNVSCVSGTCTATAADAVLNAGSLKHMLAAGDVTLQSGAGAMDIDIGGAFGWSAPSRLTLDAWRSITFNRAVTVRGAGGVTLITSDGGSGGDYGFAARGALTFDNPASSLIVNGQSFTLIDDIATLASADLAGSYALAKDYDASADGLYPAAPVPVFDGNFDGLGHAITNLSIRAHAQDAVIGLFGLAESGSIRDLRLVNAKIGEHGPGHYSIVGGLVGWNTGTVLRSSVTGTIQGTASAIAGGLIGRNDGTISLCRASAAASGGLSGGLVGESFGTISQSWAAGSVSGVDAGGLVGGYFGVAVQQSYATASVTGTTALNYAVGGLIGLYGNGHGPPITQIYSIGAVGAPGEYIGGLIGQDTSLGSNISAAYWDLDTSGVSNPSQGAGSPANDPGITGLTTTQFQSGLPSGFDPSVWGQSPGINNGYPYLLANPPQ